MKARKKPVVVEVKRLQMHSIRSYRECKEFVGEAWVDPDDMQNDLPGIKALEGIIIMEISDGDYIIKGVQGEFYTCKPDIFLETYEIIHETSPSKKALEAAESIASGLEMGLSNSIPEAVVSGLMNELPKEPLEYVDRVGGPSLTQLRKR